MSFSGIVSVRLPSATIAMLLAPNPLIGQLNSTTSIVSTPVYKGKVIPLLSVAVVKLNVIIASDADVSNVSSCLAHISPSSPGIVGMPSNKTLVRGALHTVPESARLEQNPVALDPLSEITLLLSSYSPG